MKYIQNLFFILLATTFAACNNDSPKDQTPERTVLIYIVGENSLSNLVKDDINEIKEGWEMVDKDHNYNLMIYVDTYETPRLSKIVIGANGKAEEQVIHAYTEQNSLDPNVMKQVMTEAFGEKPAPHNGLVLWSHGEGWIPGSTANARWWGQDGNVFMDIKDLREAIKASCPHLDYILFDACFMSSVETYYELQDCADYLVSSPGEIPGPGAPYQVVVPAMFKTTGIAGVNVADAYYQFYKATYDYSRGNSNYHWTAGVGLSVIKSSEMNQLAAATTNILPKYITDKQAPAYNKVQCYDGRKSYLYYYDMDRFIFYMTGGNEDYTEWRKAFDKAVVYWETTESIFAGSAPGQYIDLDMEVGGLSTFIPKINTQDYLLTYFHTLKWYGDAGWDKTGW